MSDYGLFFLPTRAKKERRTCKIRGAFSGMHRALDGWMLARAPAPPAQASTTMDLGISVFFLFYTTCGREKLGFVDQVALGME